MTTEKDFGKEAREAAWAAEQRTRHGLQSAESMFFSEKNTFRDISIVAEEARRRAELARLGFSLEFTILIYTHQIHKTRYRNFFYCLKGTEVFSRKSIRSCYWKHPTSVFLVLLG